MTSMEQVEETARLLRSGRSLAEIQRLLLPEPWQRALRACAAVESVTDSLYESVLRPHILPAGPGDIPPAGPGVPDLAELAERGLVEPVAGEPPAWRVPPPDVARWMREWSVGQPGTGPAKGLVELESALARWYADHGDRDEQLRHLLVADPKRAASTFRAMFDAADGKQDFAWCQDLLDVLADPNRITLAGPEISELRLDRAGYLRARLYWSVDYGRSAQFLKPPGLDKRTEELLSGSGPPIWQVYAAGGTGKTIQLQWLVARHCATSPVDIPCARIDFDVIDPVNVTRYPWLLLLEVAEQLDRRWPRRVFERLDRFLSYRSLARRATSELTREASHGLAGQDAGSLELQVTEMFVRRLNGAVGDRPVVLIVDTLEEVMLGSAGDPGRLIRLLAGLVRDCPALRLILAGRYDLRKRAPQLMAELGPARSVKLTDFSRRQVAAYLGGIRGITNPTLHETVFARTRGQPFLVALFADVIEAHPDITPAELARYREPATQLLIERVIQHIADPNVRWLVRYGVVPRRLRFDDVKSVMWHYMARSRLGPGKWDDPRDDQHHLRGRDDVFPFGQPPEDEAALAEVWHRLLSYAARPSWVSPADDGRSIVFHPNVRAPMRDLISGRPVFRELHGAFRRRFDRLAETDPANRSAYLREAVYHRVQLNARNAVDFWRTQVIRFRDSGDLDAMEELAGELLGDDYSDGLLPRQRSSGQPLLPYGALVQAHLFRGYVAAERARAVQAGPSDPLWAAVRRSLSDAAFVRSHAPAPSAPAPEAALEAVLRAALLVAESNPAEAVTVAEAALPGASDDSRVDLLRVIGDARAAGGDPAAESSYRTALELANARGRTDQRDAITLSLASQSEVQGRLDEAIGWVSRLAKPATDTAAGMVQAGRLSHARLLVECYRPSAALRSLDDVHALDQPSAAELALLRAQAYRLLGRADHALRELAAAATAAGQARGLYAQLAQIHQLRGVILGELLAVDDAEDSFQLAISIWGEIGFSEGHPECSYLYRRFLIRDVGDAAAAARITRPAMEAATELALRWDEDTAELHAVQGLPVRWELADPELPGLPPRQAVRAIAGRLARSWPQHRHLLPALASALGRIHPPSARLLALAELRRCGHANHRDIGLLREALGMTAPSARAKADAALQRGLLAELDRLEGDHARAGRELDRSVAGLPPLPAGRLARWRWLQARGRLQVPPHVQQVSSLVAATASYPLLRAACLFALATATPAQPRTQAQQAAARMQLEQAMAYSDRVDRPTRWAADIFRAAGEQANDGSLLATAADLDRKLGRPTRPAPPDSPAGTGPIDASRQILADRRGEQAAGLPGPGWMAADLALQRRLVAEWPGLRREMGEALFGADIWWRELATERMALRLESDEVAAHALLWELAIPPAQVAAVGGRHWPATIYRSLPEAATRIDTRWLQRALRSLGQDIPIDGVPGPMTLDALGRVFPAAGLPIGPAARAELARRLPAPGSRPSLVILLRPEAYVESSVASHMDSGFDVADLYVPYGLDVQNVTSLLDIPPVTDRDQIAVLHVAARMDMRGGGPYFDFSPAEMLERMGSKARGTDVWPKDIARWLRGCRPGREPLVVLDPPYPGSPYDVPWQLVLRNLFAATLFAEAAAPVIIATGVRAGGASYIPPIAHCIKDGEPLAVMADALRLQEDFANHNVQYPFAEFDWTADADWMSEADGLAAQATAIFAAPSGFTLAGE